jgi:hypothetical protein
MQGSSVCAIGHVRKGDRVTVQVQWMLLVTDLSFLREVWVRELAGSMSGKAIYQMILLMLVRDERDIYSHFISNSLRPIGREPQRELMFQSNQSH